MSVPRIKTFANAGTIVPTDLNSIQDDYASRLDAIYVADGHNADSIVRRGKSIVSAVGTRTNTAYGALSNGPDVVSGVVLPTGGLIFVTYSAIWVNSVAGAGRIGLFLGANQVARYTDSGGTPAQGFEVVEESHKNGTANMGVILGSAGFVTHTDPGVQNLSIGASAPTTGVAIAFHDNDPVNTLQTPHQGGALAIFATAGTYDVSVQFKATSGSVSASDRRLFVWTMGF